MNPKTCIAGWLRCACSARGPAREAQLVAYSAGNFGKNIVFASAELTFLFLLTDLIGVSGSMAGTLMLLVALGDLAFDLLAAEIVVHFQERSRNYASLLVMGAVPGGLAFALVYALPWLGFVHGTVLALALVTFRSAYALVDVPHNALMARISVNSRTRGRISGYRRFFSSISAMTIAFMIAPAVQEAAQRNDYGTMALTGLFVAAAFIVAMSACAFACRMGPGARQQGPVGLPGSRDGLAVPLHDPLVLAMLALGAVTGFAVPGFERMLLYMARYVLGEPDLVRSVLLATTLGQFAGVALWTPLAGRIDGSKLLIAAFALYAASLSGFWSAASLPVVRLAIAVLLGLAQTAIYMLPWGMLADVVDAVEWRWRRRFEAGLFAVFLVVVKSCGSASAAVIGYVLGLVGYVPGARQTPGAQDAIMALGIGLPMAGSLLAILLLYRFRLGHELHARLRRTLVRRQRTRA